MKKNNKEDSHHVDGLRHGRRVHLGLRGKRDDMRGGGVHRCNVRLDVLFVGVQLTLLPFLRTGIFAQIDVDDWSVQMVERLLDSLRDDGLLRRLDQSRDVRLLRWLNETTVCGAETFISDVGKRF